jgi:hypothetical protein
MLPTAALAAPTGPVVQPITTLPLPPGAKLPAPKPATPPVAPAPAAPVAPAPAAPVPAAPPAAEKWLQNHRATTVWAESDGTRALAPAPQWSYFRLVGAQVKARLPVFDPRTGANGWIDATTVGPSGPPPAPAPAAQAPAAPEPPKAPPFEQFWVAPFKDAALTFDAAAESEPITTIPQFAPVKVTGPAKGGFYPVEEPFAKVQGWIAADVIGKVGPPPAPSANRWWGEVAADEAYGRSEPSRNAPVVATYPKGKVVGFATWSEGEQVVWDDPAWGLVAPGVYVYGRLTRPLDLEAPPPPALPSIPSGRWIGVNRTVQLVVAYEDDKPAFWARTSTGRPGWETPLGTFKILRQVPKETMDSATLIGLDAKRADYKIENVKYTQYFTNDGNALHENWWKDPSTWGIPSSHGCAGLKPDDAQKFWDFGTVGMPVIVHL